MRKVGPSCHLFMATRLDYRFRTDSLTIFAQMPAHDPLLCLTFAESSYILIEKRAREAVLPMGTTVTSVRSHQNIPNRSCYWQWSWRHSSQSGMLMTRELLLWGRKSLKGFVDLVTQSNSDTYNTRWEGRYSVQREIFLLPQSPSISQVFLRHLEPYVPPTSIQVSIAALLSSFVSRPGNNA